MMGVGLDHRTLMCLGCAVLLQNSKLDFHQLRKPYHPGRIMTHHPGGMFMGIGSFPFWGHKGRESMPVR